ncbi:MAG: TonB-dependent receptor [Proteobacteria bacterium]|nr:TonB-dependent receptor [Pseudomonadota bacterium]
MSATYNKSMKNSTAFRRAVIVALGVAAIGTCLPAIAQEVATEVEYIDEIVATGSIIRRAETATASPVTVLTSEQLDMRGINTIADAVVMLPANNAGTMNASWSTFGFASGASAVSLRGLTTSSSLTLFDGLRMAPYPLGDDGRRNFVDLGTIPDSIVDRIEVLKDGASSTYGADAIAGVVNVITKKEIIGLHLNGSLGQSQEGDGDEYRADITWGIGDLGSDGYNFYANFEQQQSDSIPYSARNNFFGRDWTSICNSSGGCLDNRNPNGLEANGLLDGVSFSEQPLVRPVDGTGAGAGNWQLIDPAGGCTATNFLREVDVPNAATYADYLVDQALVVLDPVTGLPVLDADGNTTSASTGLIALTGPVCETGNFGSQVKVYPKIDRTGANLRFTKMVNDRTEFYVMANYYRVTTSESGGTPFIFGSTTTPGDDDVVQVTLGNVILPQYVCPLGRDGTATVCDASNGVLNPNNPFAAGGQDAQVLYRLPVPRIGDTDTQTWRVAAGVLGTLGAQDEWDYSVEVVSANVSMDLKRQGYPIPRRILNSVYDGSFNFVNPEQNSQQVWDNIAPPVTTKNTSGMDQIQATLARSLWEASGGDVIGAVGVAWREESVNQPSANGFKQDPWERYLSVNTVAAKGERDVTSAFFEIDAPLTEMFTVNVSGRYDDYSTGQDNFSPKIGLQFQPHDMIKFRATYSEGFRIPSFNEAFGAPTTGYVSTAFDPANPDHAAVIAAHGGNAYVSGVYSYGLTSVGNSELDPEESESITAGVVLELTDSLTITLDYWKIDVSSLISNADASAVLDIYYANDGGAYPEGITVIPAASDPNFPNALPLIGFIRASYQNVDSEIASGVDLGMNWTHDFGSTTFGSYLELAYLEELSKTIDGDKLNYAGTLSPCDVTSCSGAPDLRATWINTLMWSDYTVALTANYTSGYDNASIDYGAVEGDCDGNGFNSVYLYDDGSPVACTHDAYLDFDFSATYQVNDSTKVYLNILNVFDTEPDFDPAAAYFLYGFNPAWELNGWRGRYFRLGASYSFE